MHLTLNKKGTIIAVKNVSLLLTCFLLLVVGPCVQPASGQETGCDWLLARIHEAETVKAHMSRQDLRKVFNPVSVHGQLERFALKSSELIVVDVLFGTAILETGSKPPDRSIPILMMTEPLLAPSKTVEVPPPGGTSTAWLLDRIRDIETVHPRMSLTDFLKLFSQIGGLSDGNQYDLNRCIYITVDTAFTHRKLPYSLKNQDRQKLISISQPFLTYHKYVD